MEETKLSPELMKKLDQLSKKFAAEGQNLEDYLEGLLHSDYTTYWDYIRLDTLLSLQNPRTTFKDEQIFITYHQITELYFKLILSEISQVAGEEEMTIPVFIDKLHRVNRYYEQLVNSFSVLTEGMSREEFMMFRMALMPSSGFQSVQYRLIEISCTNLVNLVHPGDILWLSPDDSIEQYLDKLYWRAGARNAKTGEKSLTLRQFEDKYEEKLKYHAKAYQHLNLQQKSKQFLKKANQKQQAEIKAALRLLDQQANVQWPLSHFKAAVRHLYADKRTKAATGGTNWRQYLPPRYQRINFFPDLWNEEEKENWGKSWVQEQLS